MVVSAARRPGASAPLSRPAPRRTGSAARHTPCTPVQEKSTGSLLSLWRRFADDRDLVRLKIMLLVGLIVLAALLERAV